MYVIRITILQFIKNYYQQTSFCDRHSVHHTTIKGVLCGWKKIFSRIV